MKKDKYNNLNGLRSIAAILIILMHVGSNLDYAIKSNNTFLNFIYDLLMNSGVLVQLFFIISAFSMCCGYYEKVKENKISFDDFYSKRFKRILPFFALLTIIDLLSSLALNGNVNSGMISEAIANMTLTFGLYPNNISVIGVGWTLGVIFAFYMLFPFFVYLIWNKRRAWFSFGISIVLSYICGTYFQYPGVNDANIGMWSCFFIAGGIVYLYKEHIKALLKDKKILAAVMVFLGLFVTLLNIDEIGGFYYIKNLIGVTIALIGAISYDSKVLDNKITSFISNISFEIYLSHMFIFRIIEKSNILKFLTNSTLQFIIYVILTTIGAIVLSTVYKKIEMKIKKEK